MSSNEMCTYVTPWLVEHIPEIIFVNLMLKQRIELGV